MRLPQLDRELAGVVRPGAGEAGRGGDGGGVEGERPAVQQRLGVVAAPGLGREAAQDDPDVRDAVTVVEAQGDGGGGQGEGVGGAVADLTLRALPRPSAR